jgi:hypothetical protein
LPEREPLIDREWAWKAALEVAKAAPIGRRKSAREFAMTHRLSIADAFRRRLSRADVVKALVEMFNRVHASSLGDMDHEKENENG